MDLLNKHYSSLGRSYCFVDFIPYKQKNIMRLVNRRLETLGVETYHVWQRNSFQHWMSKGKTVSLVIFYIN